MDCCRWQKVHRCHQTFKFRSPKNRKCMQSFENRMLQLENKPKNWISGNSVKPQEDEGQSPKAFFAAWTNAPSQLNPDRDKLFNFSTKTSDQKFGVNLASAPRFLFGAPTNQVVLPLAGPHALSQVNPADRDIIFGFSGSKNFQGDFGATTYAVHRFKFGALANLQAPPHFLPLHTQIKLHIKRI